jgi:hypothetical protein
MCTLFSLLTREMDGFSKTGWYSEKIHYIAVITAALWVLIQTHIKSIKMKGMCG